FMSLRREYGGLVRFKLGRRTLHLVSRPDWIGHYLQAHQRKYRKAINRLDAVFGSGLFTSEPPLWTKQRRLMQPAFHAPQFPGYMGCLLDSCAAHTRAWRERGAGVVDLHPEMTALSLEMSLGTLFGREYRPDAREIGKAIGVAMEIINRHVYAIDPPH